MTLVSAWVWREKLGWPLWPYLVFLSSYSQPPLQISRASPTIRQMLQLTPPGLWASYTLFSIDAPLSSSSPPCNNPRIESEPISPFLIHMGLLRRHCHSSWESGPPFELSSMRMQSIVVLRRKISDGLIPSRVDSSNQGNELMKITCILASSTAPALWNLQIQ